ncbi:TPA: hypothetical protein NKR04_002332 [Vibrio parahaemolyticus]|nr:hypothetical protein [Vibrio parahaemolyticus]
MNNDEISFEKKTKYWVAKLSDVNSALSDEEKGLLDRLLGKVAAHREATGKAPLECVVVESDWPNYAETWASIERVASGNNDTVQAALEEMISNARDNGYPHHVEALCEALDRLRDNGLIPVLE